MSEEMFDVAEFWLPSEFVYDDLLREAERWRKALATAPPPPPAAAAKSFSPVGLVDGFASNPAVERDEESHLARLTQRMAHAFLLDGDRERNAPAALNAAAKPRDTAGWPATKKGGGNGPWLACSSPLSKEEQEALGEPWTLLSESAAHAMRLKLRDLVHRRELYERGLLGPQRKPNPAVPPPGVNAGSVTGYYAAPLPTIQPQREAQFFRLKELQLMKQQQQWGKQHRANGGGGYGESRCGHPLGLSPPSQPPNRKQRPHAVAGSGDMMRAVFLNSAKKQCAGTGVFIPRPAGNKVKEAPRKKTVSSTVLVPTRVAHALNLNLEELDAQARISLDHAAPISRSSALPLQKPIQLHAPPQKAATAQELRLPQEWSY